MKSCTTGVSVRFFNDMIPTGQGGIGKVTGSTLKGGRFALTKPAVLLCARHNWRHMNRDSRIFSTELVVHRREHPDHDRVVRTDSDFADRRIGQELDTRHCLAKVIEHGGSAVEQGATIL